MIDLQIPSSTQIGTAIATIIIVLFLGLWLWRSLVHAFRQWAFGEAKTNIARAWADVEKLMMTSDVMNARLAVMHADAIVDKALQVKHFRGTTFATRMQFAQRKYKGLRHVWHAHNLRNELSHNSDAVLTLPQARKAVDAFRSALRELGAL